MSNSNETRNHQDVPVTMALLYFIEVLHTARANVNAKNRLARSLGLVESEDSITHCQNLFCDVLDKEAKLIGIRLSRKTFETIMDMKLSDEINGTEEEQLSKLFVFNEWQGGIRKVH